MDNLFVEVLITRRESDLFKSLKALMVILAGISFIMIWFHPLLLVVCLVCALLAYLLHMQAVVEYEYSYLQRELTIDRILAKSRRKTLCVLSMDQVEAAGDEDHVKLEQFRQEHRKTLDFSDGTKNGKLVLYTAGKRKVLLNREEELLGALKSSIPGKLFLNQVKEIH